MKKRITRAGHARTAIALAIALLIAPAMAQNTSSAIAGRVTGGGGRPVIGADVSVIHNESGSVSKLVTDGEGRYGARGLRVGGPYTITITKDGKVERRENVYLPLAETLNLDASLGAEALQKIVVSGTSNTKIFNSAAMGTGTSLGRAELDAFASIQRNLQDYARIDPRLSQTDKERGELSAAGQNTRYNSITIDGVTTSDTFGLEANNLPTAKQPISIDAIESVQVNVANYDVTQKGYTGANINAVTKSGTNEIKGSVYYVFRDEGGIGDRYNRANGSYFPFRPFKEDTKGATLGGPIVKDKLFFFGSYEELKSNRAQPEFGPVGSALTNVAISQNQIDAIRTLAKNQYKIDIGDAIGPSELLVKDMLLKLDWNISDKHRANVRFARTEQNETNFGNFGATSLSLTSWWWDQQKSIDTVVGQWFADWTPNFSTELKVSNRDYNSVPQNNSNLPAMALQFSGPAPAGAPAGVNTGSRYLNFG
ncbi:MAG: TonB-dependent receptor, partial [Sterolibacterium sp.]